MMRAIVRLCSASKCVSPESALCGAFRSRAAAGAPSARPAGPAVGSRTARATLWCSASRAGAGALMLRGPLPVDPVPLEVYARVFPLSVRIFLTRCI